MEPTSIPKQYGGELDWKWGDMPYMDEQARAMAGGLEKTSPSLPPPPPPPSSSGPQQSKREFTKGPVLFLDDKIEVLGTVNGKARRDVVPVPPPVLSKKEDEESTKTTTDEGSSARVESLENVESGMSADSKIAMERETEVPVLESTTVQVQQ